MIEFNKKYKAVYEKLGIARDYIKQVDCVIEQKIDVDSIDSEILEKYEKMRLKNRHAFSKNVDCFLKGHLIFQGFPNKTVFFVENRSGWWISVGEYQMILDLDGSIYNLFTKKL